MTELIINEALYVDPRSGNDKFYRTFVYDSTYVFQYGRNGQIGTFKTTQCPSPEQAQTLARKKFADKIKKGYRLSRSGTLEVTPPTSDDVTWLDELVTVVPVTGSPTTSEKPTPVTLTLTAVDPYDVEALMGPRFAREHQPADIRPMLARPTGNDTLAELLTDNTWGVQYKYDGDRVVIIINEGQISVLNRAGETKTRGISAALLAPFTGFATGYWAFDGEIVDRTIVLFDVLYADCWIGPGDRFIKRYQTLRTLSGLLRGPVLAPLSTTTADKKAMLTDARDNAREGVILRALSAPYDMARRSPDLLKYKFTHSADLIVTALADDKDSATLSVYDGDALRVIGSASTIGKGDVEIGDVWEVEFLYTVNPNHPRMVQPRLLRVRTDKSATECLIDQFAHTVTNREV